MKLTCDFNQIRKGDVALVGGKAASLGEMTKAGFSVPPGFVITTEAFEDFLRVTDIGVELDSIFHKVDHNVVHTVERASHEIQNLIANAEMPQKITDEVLEQYKKLDTKFVAVRSSATSEDSDKAAWAGQLDSYLNTTRENLLENVMRCWASLFSPRAIFYRFEKSMHKHKISVAVVVQQMIASKCSGIAFSVHPVTEDRNQLLIEAGHGLGEAIVSGQITPDSYVIEKAPRTIIDKNFSAKDSQVLSNAKILQLAEIVLQIENHYGKPQDVEWAYEKGKFYITQSRPITTLSSRSIKQPKPVSSGENISMLQSSDFSKIYASKGLPFLYEDLICTHYIRWHNVIFYLNGGDYVFAGKTALQILRKEGSRRLPSEVRATAETLEQLAQKAIKAGAEIQKQGPVEQHQIKDLFALLGNILNQYGYFDQCYWDNVYVQATKNSDAQKNIMLVQNFKNEIRDKLNKIFFTPNGLFPALIKKLGKQFNIAADDLCWYLEKELSALFSGIRVKEQTLRDRQLCSIFYRDDSGRVELSEGPYALSVAKKFLQDQGKGSQEIRGKSAHAKGIVRGIVRKVIRDYTDDNVTRQSIARVKRGEILVSETTDPALSEAIKKAAAIITDIGGMLSHAAISAREYDIPCIVGTSNATLRLQDGDLVEIDSRRGTVKVLESSKS